MVEEFEWIWMSWWKSLKEFGRVWYVWERCDWCCDTKNGRVFCLMLRFYNNPHTPSSPTLPPKTPKITPTTPTNTFKTHTNPHITTTFYPLRNIFTEQYVGKNTLSHPFILFHILSHLFITKIILKSYQKWKIFMFFYTLLLDIQLIIWYNTTNLKIELYNNNKHGK